MAAAEGDEITINTKVIHIHASANGDKCKPWEVTSYSTIDGRDFIVLSKTDSGFARFVTGEAKSTQFRSVNWLDELRRHRTLGTMEARLMHKSDAMPGR